MTVKPSIPSRQCLVECAVFVWFALFGLLYLRSSGHAPPEFESGNFARALMQTGRYAWSINTPWDMGGFTLTAHKAPLLSWILVGVWSIVPASFAAPCITLINAAAESLALVAICRIVPATLRAWVVATFALSPFVLMNIPAIMDSAVTHALLAWGCYYAVTYVDDWHRAACAGFLIGLAALALPASMLLGACLLAWLVLATQYPQKRAVALAFTITAALTVGGWTARNAMIFHRLIPVASNLPLELYYGNNPTATGGMMNDACRQITVLDDAHKQALRGLDEVSGYAQMGDEAVTWARDNPTQALALRPRAWAYFWHPQAFWLGHCPAYAGLRWRVMNLVNIVYLAGASIGLGLLFARAQRRLAWTVTFALLSTSAVYAVTHADIGWRYRAPIEPMLCVLCALAAKALIALGRRHICERAPH